MGHVAIMGEVQCGNMHIAKVSMLPTRNLAVLQWYLENFSS